MLKSYFFMVTQHYQGLSTLIGITILYQGHQTLSWCPHFISITILYQGHHILPWSPHFIEVTKLYWNLHTLFVCSHFIRVKTFFLSFPDFIGLPNFIRVSPLIGALNTLQGHHTLLEKPNFSGVCNLVWELHQFSRATQLFSFHHTL